MKVLLVNGSPNPKGNTHKSLELAAEVLHNRGIETEEFQIGNKPVHGCIACEKCEELGRCVFDDDPANALMQAMKDADGVLVGSPVYFGGPTGALCTLLDRVFYVGADKQRAFAHKPVGAIVNGWKAGGTFALERLNQYFTFGEMLVVSSFYWNVIMNTDPNRAETETYGREVVINLAENMAWTLQHLH